MPPPENLYIYEIEGRVEAPPEQAGADFLGCWREGDCSYLFFSAPREERLRAWLAASGAGRYCSDTVLSYDEWEAGKPLQPASLAGFHLYPLWEEPAPAPGETVIRLEPGLAFGSGYHPTTRGWMSHLLGIDQAIGRWPYGSRTCWKNEAGKVRALLVVPAANLTGLTQMRQLFGEFGILRVVHGAGDH